MKTLLFLIDDSDIGFWKRRQREIWEGHLTRLKSNGTKIHEIRATTAAAVMESVQKAKGSGAAPAGLLVTDQMLFGGDLDGADLAEGLLKAGLVERAVVFSEIARLKPEQHGLALLAESRVSSQDAIDGVFVFLETGQSSKIEGFFRFAARLRDAHEFFRDSVRNFKGEMSGERLLRPAAGYGVLGGDLSDGGYLLDAWLMELGADVPELFSVDSAHLFGEDVWREMLQYFGGAPNEAVALAKWTRVLDCLHPWKCLQRSGARLPAGDGPQGGAFRLMVEITKCGGNAAMIPALQSEEVGLAPRERAWLRLRRVELRSCIGAVVKGGGPSLSQCVQQCVEELDDVCAVLKVAADIKAQN
jgi:hypothetical protein